MALEDCMINWNVQVGKCRTCGKGISPGHFRDRLSAKEFGISGMCQKCQDEVFGEGE